MKVCYFENAQNKSAFSANFVKYSSNAQNEKRLIRKMCGMKKGIRRTRMMAPNALNEPNLALGK
jgi:hypothetical protein